MTIDEGMAVARENLERHLVDMLRRSETSLLLAGHDVDDIDSLLRDMRDQNQAALDEHLTRTRAELAAWLTDGR